MFNTKVLSKFTTLLDSRRTIYKKASSPSKENPVTQATPLIKKVEMKKPTTKHPLHYTSLDESLHYYYGGAFVCLFFLYTATEGVYKTTTGWRYQVDWSWVEPKLVVFSIWGLTCFLDILYKELRAEPERPLIWKITLGLVFFQGAVVWCFLLYVFVFRYSYF